MSEKDSNKWEIRAHKVLRTLAATFAAAVFLGSGYVAVDPPAPQENSEEYKARIIDVMGNKTLTRIMASAAQNNGKEILDRVRTAHENGENTVVSDLGAVTIDIKQLERDAKETVLSTDQFMSKLRKGFAIALFTVGVLASFETEKQHNAIEMLKIMNKYH